MPERDAVEELTKLHDRLRWADGAEYGPDDTVTIARETITLCRRLLAERDALNELTDRQASDGVELAAENGRLRAQITPPAEVRQWVREILAYIMRKEDVTATQIPPSIAAIDWLDSIAGGTER